MPVPASSLPRPVMLVILDGFGWREEQADNAVRLAHIPTFDRLWRESPHAFLKTSGEDVGLPEGQMGNSEVGHLNIGAGRVVMQDLPRISKSAREGTLAQNPALAAFIDSLRKSGGTAHLMGLVSPGGVHAHQDHILALARILTGAKIPTALHIFSDGRDTAPYSGEEYVGALLRDLPPEVRVATISGRYYAMDRDNRWERVRLAVDALRDAKGPHAENALSVLAASYAEERGDEFVIPTVLGDYAGMKDGDGILSANFRSDRIRELLDALLLPEFGGYDRGRRVNFAAAAGMTRYSDSLAPHMGVLFPKVPLDSLLGEVVAKAGKTQLRIAETEKYPHVTYFLNGGREVSYEGEERILVPSPKVATYDLQPEMSAPEVTERAVGAIESGKFDLIVLNFANPDMVGHTGSLEAAIKACEAVDEGLGKIDAAITKAGGALLVIADHGNCETMRDPETGGAHTSHTLNLVPAILAHAPGEKIHDGRLADVAPTLLALLGVPRPEAMTGAPLLEPA